MAVILPESEFEYFKTEFSAEIIHKLEEAGKVIVSRGEN